MGELDIIEGVHHQRLNKIAFHSGSTCYLDPAEQAGRVIFQNCNSFEPRQPENSGCQVEDSSLGFRGPSFGQHGGGVYAVDWTTEAVRVWSFSRDQIPPDITSGNPQPESWGKPVFMLKGICVTADNFRDQRLVRFSASS